MTSGRGSLRRASLRTLRAAITSSFIVVAILFASSAYTQVSGDSTLGRSVSRLYVTPTVLEFKKIDLSSGTVTETMSFIVEDTGGSPLSVTVGAPIGSKFFKITAGQGAAVVQPHAKSTVTVEFAPTRDGKDLSAKIKISSDATAGVPSAKVKVSGSAKKKRRPTPTATATGTATPTATSTPTATPTATFTTSTATATATPGALSDVLTYHNDIARTGQNLSEQDLTPGNVATSFGKLFEDAVDGKVDAQPLIKTQVSIPEQGTHNVIYVATEHDSVYAFDADSSGPALWQVSVLGAGEAPSDTRGCGQITPEIGITSTPVIDPAAGLHGTIYLVAMSKNTTSGAYFQRIHALDITTGAEEFGGPVTVAATFSPGPAFSPMQYKERASLLLVGGQLITAWASHCDNTPYNGWIMAYNQNTLAQTSVLDITANGSEGAIWQSGGGLAADGAGNIYLLDGNGTFDTTLNANGFPIKGDFGNGFLKLSNSGGLQVADFFEPFNTVLESDGDLDLGSGGAMVLPDMTDAGNVTRHLVVGAGKDRNIYLLDRDNMGKWNSKNNSNAYQVLAGVLSGGAWSLPAYFNGTVYFGSVSDPLQAFTFSQAKLGTTPSSISSESYAYPGTSPSVSANGTTNAIVWAVENGSGGGVLHAYDATNLATELYNSSTVPADSFEDNKFVTPAIANGKVYVGTPDSVAVFGLKP